MIPLLLLVHLPAMPSFSLFPNWNPLYPLGPLPLCCLPYLLIRFKVSFLLSATEIASVFGRHSLHYAVDNVHLTLGCGLLERRDHDGPNFVCPIHGLALRWWWISCNIHSEVCFQNEGRALPMFLVAEKPIGNPFYLCTVVITLQKCKLFQLI